MRKLKMFVVITILLTISSFLVIQASETKQTNEFRQPLAAFSSSYESYGQVENQAKVEQTADVADLLVSGFELVACTDDISLYLNRDILNIAVVDLRTDYIWYGYYPNYETKGYTASVKELIESGVTVDYFDAESLNEGRMSVTNPDAGTLLNYTLNSSGFTAHINMVKVGISFDLSISIESDQVNVLIPYESIVEVPYKTVAMKYARDYKVNSILVFPYFGSENYEINGYAMVPDGSGALIRYEDTPYNSAYVRRVYGRDLGIQTSITSLSHLKEESPLSLPLYGINHGFEQAAFLAEIKSGFGAAELHSYPYMYDNIDINTTFFTYKTRDRSLIKLSGGTTSTIPLINKDPYPFDFEMSYSFLANEEASYSGMANRYREQIEFKEDAITNPSKIHLGVVGLDYKPSLLGDQSVKLTTYAELLDISKDLANEIDGILISYRSYNRGGIFGKNTNTFKAAAQLGGARGLRNLIEGTDALDEVTLSLYHDPMVVAEQRAFQSVLRKTTLDIFYANTESSRLDYGYYLKVDEIADRILKNDVKFKDNNILNLSLSSVGELNFSYQIGQKTVYREEMIHQVEEELSLLDDYQIGLYRPADYTFSSINRYYNMFHQSNMYSYMTDSIPFISMVLSGHIELFSTELNFVNNLDTMTLKMIEYGLRPSFIVTNAPGHELRYTNYEYLFTTEYDLWKDQIIKTKEDVGLVLDQVVGAQIIMHHYIAEGVAQIIYSNGFTVYVNYTSTAYSAGGIIVGAHSAQVTP